MPETELCPNCDREWPSKFGAHNCNYQKRSIHKQAIVIEPGAPLHRSIEQLASRLEQESKRSAEYANLAGEEGPYRWTLAQIDASIGFLKQFRLDIQRLQKHEHRWNEDDYCDVCGADGRA